MYCIVCYRWMTQREILHFRAIEGMVTVGHIMSELTKRKVKGHDPVSTVLYKQFKCVSISTAVHYFVFWWHY